MQSVRHLKFLHLIVVLGLFNAIAGWSQTAINYSVHVFPKSSAEYQTRKAWLLEALSEIERTVKAAETSNSTKVLQELIDLGRRHFQADALPLGITDEPDVAAFLQTSVGKEKTEHVLAFSHEFPERFVTGDDNYQWFGTLLRQLQHLSDWQRYGVNDDRVRIFVVMESAGFLVQAWYYQLLDPNWVDAHPKAKAIVVAAADAPHGPLWRAYLDQVTKFDLALLELLESYQYHALPTLSSAFPAIPDVLLPQAKLAAARLKNAVTFMDSHKPTECSADDPEFENFVKDVRFVATYMYGGNNMFNNFVGPKLGNPDGNSRQIYQEWKQLHRTIQAGYGALAGRKDFAEFNKLGAEEF